MSEDGLVTIGLKAYNQRATIGAALEGVLSQTYRPLEVVISDDGSSDGTWEELERLVGEKRRDGDGCEVRIVLNRNETNLGNMGNWLQICELAHGEWIVKCDGDDISEPTRVERLMEAIRAAKGPVFVACSGGVRIDASGREIRRFKARSARYPLGACMAFHRDCFIRFPRPENRRIVDDEVFARRALMLGDELRVDLPLVRYRIGSGISSDSSNMRQAELRCMRQFPESLAQCRRDLEAIRADIGEPKYAEWTARLDSDERQHAASATLLGAPRFGDRWRAYRTLEKPPITVPYRWKLMLYLLPAPIGDFLLRLMARLRQQCGMRRPE